MAGTAASVRPATPVTSPATSVSPAAPSVRQSRTRMRAAGYSTQYRAPAPNSVQVLFRSLISNRFAMTTSDIKPVPSSSYTV